MKNTETGRSMVEMLGVLAIIGVLSVAGIAGYSMAMKKYRSNEILNYASQAVILAQTYNGGAGISANTSAATLGLTGLPNYITGLSVTPPSAGTKYTVVVTDTSDSCATAQEHEGTTYTISCGNQPT